MREDIVYRDSLHLIPALWTTHIGSWEEELSQAWSKCRGTSPNKMSRWSHSHCPLSWLRLPCFLSHLHSINVPKWLNFLCDYLRPFRECQHTALRYNCPLVYCFRKPWLPQKIAFGLVFGLPWILLADVYWISGSPAYWLVAWNDAWQLTRSARIFPNRPAGTQRLKINMQGNYGHQR